MQFMQYADDTVWLLFALGLGTIAVVVTVFVLFRLFNWASIGFLIMGTLISISYYSVGSHPALSGTEASKNKPSANE